MSKSLNWGEIWAELKEPWNKEDQDPHKYRKLFIEVLFPKGFMFKMDFLQGKHTHTK